MKRSRAGTALFLFFIYDKRRRARNMIYTVVALSECMINVAVPSRRARPERREGREADAGDGDRRGNGERRLVE